MFNAHYIHLVWAIAYQHIQRSLLHSWTTPLVPSLINSRVDLRLGV